MSFSFGRRMVEWVSIVSIDALADIDAVVR